MVYKTGKWDISDLLNEKDIDSKLSEIDEKVKIFEDKRDLLKHDVDSKVINDMLQLSDDISRSLTPIIFYGDLGFNANTKSEKFIQLNTKLKQKSTEMSNRMRFFDIWWKELDDKNAERILNGLKINRYSMKRARDLKKHLLSESEEAIIALKDDTGSRALDELYSIITTGLDFEYRGRKASQQELMILFKSQNAKERKDAFDALLNKYKENSSVLGHIFQNLVSDYVKENIKLRKFESPLGTRAIHDDVPVEAIETLLKVSQKNRKIFAEYFKLKQKILKIKKMRAYDILASYPIKEKNIPYNDAVNTVLDVFGEFDPEFKKHTKTIIDKKHIDSEVRKDKYPSAFCESAPPVVPYIMMNYSGNDEDVRTLIHELGHGVHAMLAANNTMSESHSTVGLAETASVFSEHILLKRQLKEKKDKKYKIALLMSIMDDLYSTIQRQTAYVLFEKDTYELIKNGCSMEDINQAWFKRSKEIFNDEIEVPEIFKYGWLRIPHLFHWPFYCYGYAFGNLLVLALMKMYEKEGKSFIPKFKKILSSGSSKSPESILKEVGIDIRSEKFWQQGFDIVQEYFDELKRLT